MSMAPEVGRDELLGFTSTGNGSVAWQQFHSGEDGLKLWR